jgi:hypothetical protein
LHLDICGFKLLPTFRLWLVRELKVINFRLST